MSDRVESIVVDPRLEAGTPRIMPYIWYLWTPSGESVVNQEATCASSRARLIRAEGATRVEKEKRRRRRTARANDGGDVKKKIRVGERTSKVKNISGLFFNLGLI